MTTQPFEIMNTDETRPYLRWPSLGVAVKYAVTRGTGVSEPAIRRGREVLERRDDPSCGDWVNGGHPNVIQAWLRDAPQNLVDAVQAIKDEIEDAVDAPVRKRRKLRKNRDFGDELDPQAWLTRRTDGWSQMSVTHKPKHIVRLAVNCAVNCFANSSMLLYRGAAIAALADLLTDQGFSVEVSIMHVSDNPSKRVKRQTHEIVVKESDGPMIESNIYVALCEIGFSRSITHVLKAKTTWDGISSGLGQAGLLNASERAQFDAILDSNVLNRQTAVSAVLDCLRKFKIDREAFAA